MMWWLSAGGWALRQLDSAVKRRDDAKTETARIAADADVARIRARMEAQTQGLWSWLPKLIQALFAVPFLVYIWKLIIWDKVLGWGVTDPIGDYELRVSAIVIGFYFLTSGASTVVDRIKRK